MEEILQDCVMENNDKKGGKEISIEDACYIPQELTEWETKFWSGEFKFPMKGPLCPLSEYM